MQQNVPQIKRKRRSVGKAVGSAEKEGKALAFENPYLADFTPIFFAVLKEKGIDPAKMEVIIFDEETEEHHPFERIGVLEVLYQLSGKINALTIYTDRPDFFQKFIDQTYEETGLLVIIRRKTEQIKAVRKNTDGKINVVLDFEWGGVCRRPDKGICSGYIPIHKIPWEIPWEMRENLDILVPFGYNTVIVKSNHTKDRIFVRDRFDEGFYRDE